jgi:hypothetical protein
MSILFRCPCGRSMVVESDRAGSQVMCPNCRRTLKVPSGQDRGVELAPVPAAARTRTSRICQRCRKEVPVDVQMCPHCKAILLDGSSMAAAAAAAIGTPGAPTAKPGAGKTGAKTASGQAGSPILYGGNRGSWWSQMSNGGKAGLVGGIAGGALLLIIILVVSGSFGGSPGVAREEGRKILEQGKKFEILGKFQEAYVLYSSTARERTLRGSSQADDVALADQLHNRFLALQYLAHEPQIRTGESVYWIPKNQAELDQGQAALRSGYTPFRNACSNLATFMMAATQAAQTTPTQAEYEAKVGQAMDKYAELVAKATKEQIAGHCFQQLLAAVQSMTNATRSWDKADLRNIELVRAFKYFEALKERAEQEPFGDALWQRHGKSSNLPK